MLFKYTESTKYAILAFSYVRPLSRLKQGLDEPRRIWQKEAIDPTRLSSKDCRMVGKALASLRFGFSCSIADRV